MLWAATRRVHRRTRFSKGSLGLLIYSQDICSTKLAHTDQQSLQLSSLHAAVQPLNSRQTEPFITLLLLTFAYPPSGLLRAFSSFEPELKEDQGGIFHWKAEIFWHLVLQPKTRLLPVGSVGKHCSVQPAPGNSQWLICSLSSTISILVQTPSEQVCVAGYWAAGGVQGTEIFIFYLRFNIFWFCLWTIVRPWRQSF